jgi:carboxymethylenebutenolidase
MPNAMIELTASGTMPTYVAEPAGTPRGGVIIVQEIFGISPPMKHAADLAASEGFLAVVPAMFHRVDPNFIAEYNEEGFMRGVGAAKQATLADVTADLSAAADYIREKLGAEASVIVWGFCYGGTVAFLAGTMPFVDASIAFYGGAIAGQFGDVSPIEKTAEIHVPMLLAFGAEDEHIPPEAVEKVRAALEREKKSFELHSYPGADHGFFRAGENSSPQATQAWESVKAFLAANAG